MIPKVEACIRAVRAGVARAHILDGRVAPRAAARDLHRRRGGHHGARRTSDDPPPTGHLTRTVAGRHARPQRPDAHLPGAARSPSCGARARELWDTEGRRYLDFLSRPGRDVARPRPPGGGRGRWPSRPGRCCTSPTCSATSSARGWPPPSTACIGGGTSRPADRCSSPTPGPRPTSAP